MRLIVATNNQKKLRELKQILGVYFQEVLSLREAGIVHETVEDGSTFEENALKKATEAARISGCAAVADDSGLEVDALGGAPGVYSARYAGEPCDDEANLRLVLRNMEGVADRTARFVSAIALVVGDRSLVCRGTVEGWLLEEPQGEGGFGYDPIFYYPPFGCTLAQVESDRKNAVSHRGNAIRALVAQIEATGFLKTEQEQKERNQEWFEISIETTHEAVEAVGGLLMQMGVTGWATEDAADLDEFLQQNRELWDYVDEELHAKNRQSVTIRVYLPDNVQGNETLRLIRSGLKAYRETERELDTGSLAVTVGRVNEEDWANNWKKYFHPIPIGNRLTVCPSWEEYENPEHRKVLRIDPGSAFGTGGHATTRLCLEALEHLVQGGENVLDVGCGSGILAVASVLLGARYARGVDIDENSVTVARETAQRNGAEQKTAFQQADLVQGISGKYDLITANIVADIVMRLAPMVRPLLAEGGKWIASGIIDDRSEEVQEHMKALGFRVEQVLESEGWVAIVASL